MYKMLAVFRPQLTWATLTALPFNGDYEGTKNVPLLIYIIIELSMGIRHVE